MAPYFVPVPDLEHDKIQAAFQSATLVDVAQAAMRQRMIKSAEEIEVIKHGARIGDLGGEAIRNAITAGITEYEVALIGTEAMVVCKDVLQLDDAETRKVKRWAIRALIEAARKPAAG